MTIFLCFSFLLLCLQEIWAANGLRSTWSASILFCTSGRNQPHTTDDNNLTKNTWIASAKYTLSYGVILFQQRRSTTKHACSGQNSCETETNCVLCNTTLTEWPLLYLSGMLRNMSTDGKLTLQHPSKETIEKIINDFNDDNAECQVYRQKQNKTEYIRCTEEYELSCSNKKENQEQKFHFTLQLERSSPLDMSNYTTAKSIGKINLGEDILEFIKEHKITIVVIAAVILGSLIVDILCIKCLVKRKIKKAIIQNIKQNQSYLGDQNSNSEPIVQVYKNIPMSNPNPEAPSKSCLHYETVGQVKADLNTYVLNQNNAHVPRERSETFDSRFDRLGAKSGDYDTAWSSHLNTRCRLSDYDDVKLIAFKALDNDDLCSKQPTIPISSTKPTVSTNISDFEKMKTLDISESIRQKHEDQNCRSSSMKKENNSLKDRASKMIKRLTKNEDKNKGDLVHVNNDCMNNTLLKSPSKKEKEYFPGQEGKKLNCDPETTTRLIATNGINNNESKKRDNGSLECYSLASPILENISIDTEPGEKMENEPMQNSSELQTQCDSYKLSHQTDEINLDKESKTPSISTEQKLSEPNQNSISFLKENLLMELDVNPSFDESNTDSKYMSYEQCATHGLSSSKCNKTAEEMVDEATAVLLANL